MKLALAMGRPDVDRFAEELTANEFREWEAFWQIEPFGDDWRMAARAAIFTARSFGAKIDANTEDMFFPGFDPFEQKQTPEEMRATFEKIKARQNARVIKNHGKV
jgi:hypothetical protein